MMPWLDACVQWFWSCKRNDCAEGDTLGVCGTETAWANYQRETGIKDMLREEATILKHWRTT